jgi:hypothetical protein
MMATSVTMPSGKKMETKEMKEDLRVEQPVSMK